jgi:hypothetical protein
MRFREWLLMTEAGQQRSHIVGNRDQTTNLGPTSQFGGPRTMLPVSFGIDNRAFAGVVDGIGTARAKIRADMGAEPGAASHYEPLQDMRRSNLQTMYLPLQYDKNTVEGEAVYVTKGLVARLKSSFDDPMKNEGVYRVGENNELLAGHEDPRDMLTKLYVTSRDEGHNGFNEPSLNYTTALMQASLSKKLSKYSHLINLERPNISQRKIIPLPIKDIQGNEKEQKPYSPEDSPKFYHVMMCAFVLNPKSKDHEFDSDFHGEIDRLLGRGAIGQKQGQPEKTRPAMDVSRMGKPEYQYKPQRPTTEIPSPEK